VNARLLAAAALFVASAAGAQTPCSTRRAIVDSARADVFTVLGGNSKLVQELRQENGLQADHLAPVTVTDRAVCARLAPAFNRVIPPGVEYAVLRVGPLYYARDPDQRRSTGVVTDSTYKVVMRLGAEIPEPRRRP
jgi:hypothetical protein